MAQIEGMGGQFLYMPGGGSLNPATHETVDKKMHYIHQDGKNVFKYAVKKMAEMTERILEKNKLTGKDIDCFIAHQANRRIITATADRLGMPLEKVIINIDRYGNTTAGTIPIAMQTAVEEGKLKKGDLLADRERGRWVHFGGVACCAGHFSIRRRASGVKASNGRISAPLNCRALHYAGCMLFAAGKPVTLQSAGLTPAPEV